MTKYFIRTGLSNAFELEVYLATKKAKYTLVSNEFGRAEMTVLYSVELDRQEAVVLKLSVPMIGMIEQPLTQDIHNVTINT
jgi:hypothetical protein